MMTLTVLTSLSLGLSNNCLSYVDVLKDGRVYVHKSFQIDDDRKFLDALAEDKDYHIVIENDGGMTDILIPMRNRIKELQAKGYHITTEVNSRAISCGAFLWMLGDTRIAHETASLMFHQAGFYTGYGRIDFKDLNDLQKRSITHTNYVLRQDLLRVVKDTELVNEMMVDSAEGYWLFGDEIKELGIATEYKDI